jgi:hypothetical protein
MPKWSNHPGPTNATGAGKCAMFPSLVQEVAIGVNKDIL